MKRLFVSDLDGTLLQKDAEFSAYTAKTLNEAIKKGLKFTISTARTPASALQILDILDYISNYILMPLIAIGTCILIGWIVKPQTVIDECTKNGEKFGRKGLFVVMIKFIAPVLLCILFLISAGILKLQ